VSSPIKIGDIRAWKVGSTYYEPSSLFFLVTKEYVTKNVIDSQIYVSYEVYDISDEYTYEVTDKSILYDSELIDDGP
jgi:hypothetical protein